MRAVYDVEDPALSAHVRFASGFWLTLQGAWVWDEPGWNYSFDLVGDRGQAQLDPLRFSGERDGALGALWPRGRGWDRLPLLGRRRAARLRRGDPRGPGARGASRQALVVQCIVDALYDSAASGRRSPSPCRRRPMPGFAADFAAAYIELEMAKEVAAIVALFADGVLRTPERELAGASALAAFYVEFLAPMAEIRLELGRVFGDERGLVFEWEGLTEFRDGSLVRALGCDVMSLEGGLISLSTVHLHRLETLRGAS